MKNRFNLDQLRSDAAKYLAPQLISSKSPHQTISESVSDVINPNKFEFLTNVMVVHLIGSLAYGTLNFDSTATIEL